MEALAVHVFWVAVDAVAALHLRDGGRRVGGRAQGVRVVSHAAPELDIVLIPVPPQNRLDLREHIWTINIIQLSRLNLRDTIPGYRL